MRFCQTNIAFIILFIYQLLVLWYCYDLVLEFFKNYFGRDNVIKEILLLYFVFTIPVQLFWILLNQYFCGTAMSVISGIVIFIYFVIFTLYACCANYFKQNDVFGGGGLANRKRSKHIQKKRSRR